MTIFIKVQSANYSCMSIGMFQFNESARYLLSISDRFLKRINFFKGIRLKFKAINSTEGITFMENTWKGSARERAGGARERADSARERAGCTTAPHQTD